MQTTHLKPKLTRANVKLAKQKCHFMGSFLSIMVSVGVDKILIKRCQLKLYIKLSAPTF